MLHISITFDYELFMGDNYVSEKEVLIDPTDKLSSMLSKLGISATFFADVCCPECYRKFGSSDFPELFDEQLAQLIEKGHDVQLHIHPHWLKATEIGRHISFDRQAYRIHNWENGDDYRKIREMIHDGKTYLENIIKPINGDYRCVAFRAGGYCLQPEKQIAPILFEEGIRIDSSVCMGFSHDGDGMYYDYRKQPVKRNIFFNGEYGLSDNMTKPVKGGIFEVPVGDYKTFPFRLIASKLNRRISKAAPNGKGMAIQSSSVAKITLMSKVKQSVIASNMFTFDFYNAVAMSYMLQRIVKEEHCNKRDVYIAVIAHPKGQSDAHIDNMKRAVEKLRQNKSIDFVSMRQIADMLDL